MCVIEVREYAFSFSRLLFCYQTEQMGAAPAARGLSKREQTFSWSGFLRRTAFVLCIRCMLGNIHRTMVRLNGIGLAHIDDATHWCQIYHGLATFIFLDGCRSQVTPCVFHITCINNFDSSFRHAYLTASPRQLMLSALSVDCGNRSVTESESMDRVGLIVSRLSYYSVTKLWLLLSH